MKGSDLVAVFPLDESEDGPLVAHTPDGRLWLRTEGLYEVPGPWDTDDDVREDYAIGMGWPRAYVEENFGTLTPVTQGRRAEAASFLSESATSYLAAAMIDGCTTDNRIGLRATAHRWLAVSAALTEDGTR